MKVDSDTGALESGRWRLDPRGPQSSFVQWARATGFAGRYEAQADGWLVSVFFGVRGGLERVSMSMGDHDAHERWVAEQRWPRGVKGTADWDRHYSDSRVYVEWAPSTTDGPAPEPGDVEVIARAPRLDLHPVGPDWELSPQYLAWERLCRQPPPEDALAPVFQTGTAAGRCYAAHLVPEAWRALQDDRSPLSVADAPLMTVADYARGRVA